MNFLYALKARISLVLKGLSDGPELNIAIGIEGLVDGAGAASATTNPAELQFAAVRLAKGDAGQCQRAGSRGCG